MYKSFVTSLSFVVVSFATAIVFLLSGISASAGDNSRSAGIPESIAKSRQERGSMPFRNAVERYYDGRTDAIGKIIGGKPAKWDNHPWQAALLVSVIADPAYAQFCGGSLVGEKKEWVVTAAHCVYSKGITISTDAVHVLTGTADLSTGGKRSNVDAIYVYKEYDPSKHNNDIALLKLKESGIGKSIIPISEKEEPRIVVSGKDTTVTGWGYTEKGLPSPTLKYVDVPLVDREMCNGPGSYDGAITDKMICAGPDGGHKDSCQGDSGGPNVKDSFLIGIVSWGDGCGKPFKYGVYTRVSQFADWIEACIKDQESCKSK